MECYVQKKTCVVRSGNRKGYNFLQNTSNNLIQIYINIYTVTEDN